MKFGIVVFPGSNCDEDAFHAAKDVFGQQADYLWHWQGNPVQWPFVLAAELGPVN